MDHAQPNRPKKMLARKRGPAFLLKDRDCQIMKYIWRWKIASTSSVHEAINRTASPYATYKILDRLERNHMVESRFNLSERFHVWQLTEFGFYAIRELLGELKEDGYLSENHRHDRYVQAFHLGEWSTHQFPRVIFCTEQELRRREPENYPDWVPQLGDHRADGYTRILGEKQNWTIAFEVELSAKNVQRYEGILRSYLSARLVNQVMWLVEDDTVKETILRAKDCIKDESSNFHVFVDLSDFKKNGWDAVITNERSETLSTMRKKYRGIVGEIAGEILGNYQGQSRVCVHLENKKVIGKSKT